MKLCKDQQLIFNPCVNAWKSMALICVARISSPVHKQRTLLFPIDIERMIE